MQLELSKNALPTLPRLTPDDQIWRLDWIGEIGYPGAVAQYRQPCIRVAISPLLEASSVFGMSKTIKTDISQQHNVWVPLGALSMLSIGGLWQHGQLVESPAYIETCFDLNITPDATTFVKAGLAIDDDYLLPFAEHPWHSAHTQSYCLSVKVRENETLIIPGAEMVRFYFGSSSNLIKSLIAAPFYEDTLWHKTTFNPSTRHLHLRLAPGLSGTSASDIGRIALDRSALNAATSIYTHILKATSLREPTYLYARFPFRGRTKILAKGIWLSYAGRPKSTFLVYSLRSCSHPFPFESLTYEAGDRKIRRRSTVADQAPGSKKPVQSGSGSTTGQIDHGDPGTQKIRRQFSFDHSVRFPDLKRKSIWRERILATGATEILIKRADGSLEKLAFGDPEGSGDARAIDVGIGEPPAEIAEMTHQQLPHFVRIGISMAMSQHACPATATTAKPLLPFGRAEPVLMLPMVVDADGVVDTSLMHTGLDGEQRLKRVCFVAMLDGGRETKKLAIVEGASFQSAPVVVAVQSTDLVKLIQLL